MNSRPAQKQWVWVSTRTTKILSNQDRVKTKEITVDNIKIEVLAKGDSPRYLGKKITFEEQETEEIKNRLTDFATDFAFSIW